MKGVEQGGDRRGVPLANGGTDKRRGFGVAVVRERTSDVPMYGKGVAEVAHAARIPVADGAPLGRRSGRVLNVVPRSLFELGVGELCM